MEVINLLWPKDTISKVTRLFWQVYRRVEDMEEGGITHEDTALIVWRDAYPQQEGITWPDFIDCWLFKAVSAWIDDEAIEIKNRAKIKKTLFETLLSKRSNWM